MPVWKMFFVGRTEMDVQGVYLRQLIKEIADHKDFQINGQVRNLKDGRVEVICEGGKDRADKFYRAVINKAGEKRIRIKEEDCVEPTDDIFGFRDFRVIREDDLREMVWALQGAGRIFKEQEEVRREEVIKGLRYELHSVSDAVQKIIEEGWVNKRLRIISLENILTQPPFDSDDSMMKINELYERCREINDLRSRGVDNGLKEELEKILKLSDDIEDMLKKQGFK